jgi:hypothetical protein
MIDKHRQQSRSRRAKAIALLAVSAIHVAAVVIMLASSPPLPRFVELADAVILIRLPEPAARPETTAREKEAGPPRHVKRERLLPKAPGVGAAPAQSTAPVGLPWVDWQQEREGAAKKKADATPWQSVVSKTKQKPPHEFGWSQARTHRIERDEETGVTTRINLNDRCALIAALLFLPVCQFGKIPARGDLFDGMKDPDRPGSVPDAPKSDVVKSE